MEFFLQVDPGQMKNCLHCCFLEFHSLSKENQISLLETFCSDPSSSRESEGVESWDL